MRGGQHPPKWWVSTNKVPSGSLLTIELKTLLQKNKLDTISYASYCIWLIIHN
jgi:hypothetical protein